MPLTRSNDTTPTDASHISLAARTRRRSAQRVLKKELGLFDLVLTQIVFVVGTIWVGWAAKLGDDQMVFWLLAIVTFYLPLAAVVIFLNRLMPLKAASINGPSWRSTISLRSWWRGTFGSLASSVMSGIGLIIKKNIAYAIGPRADWMHENKLMTTLICTLLMVMMIAASRRGLMLGKWVQNFGGAFSAVNVRDPDPAAVHHRRPRHARELPSVFDQLSGSEHVQHQRLQQTCGGRAVRL